jgi:hypothetical protein
MKPPICKMCFPDSKLRKIQNGVSMNVITFKHNQDKIDYHMGQNCEWFCDEHYKIAKKYKDMYIEEAMDILLSQTI